MSEGGTPQDPREEPHPEPPATPDTPGAAGGQPQPGTPEEPGTPAPEAPAAPGGYPPPPPQGYPPPPPGGYPPPPPGYPPPQGGWGQGYGQPGGYPPPPPGYPPPQGGWGPGPGGPTGPNQFSESAASGLAYLLVWVSGLFFFFTDQRQEVRFHAMQSILFGAAWTVVTLFARSGVVVVDQLFGLLSLVGVVLWLLLMLFAFQGQHFKLPVVGDFAEQLAARTP